MQDRPRESFDQTLNTDIHDIHDPKDSLTVDKRAEVEKKVRSSILLYSDFSNAPLLRPQMEQLEREKDNKYERDPTLAAREQGNKPSRGAEIDAELAEDDRKTLEKKGIPVE